MKNKMTINIKKNWSFFVILIIAIISMLLISFYSLDISEKLYDISDEIKAEDYIKNIKKGDIIEKNIYAQKDNFERVDIEFEPLKEAENISGKVRIEIYDDNGNMISKQTITRNNIRENTKYEFRFNRQKKSSEKEYLLKIKFEEIDEGKDFFSIKTDGQGNIVIQEFYKNITKQTFFIYVITIFSIYILCISTFIFYKEKIKPEKIFLYTVPAICILYIICIPTFKNHDELYHWYRGYEVSIGRLATGVEGDILGTEMPENISKPTTKDWTKITYKNVIEYMNLGLETEKQTILYSETSAVYSFIQYLPQGIGIFIARLFTDKVLLLAYGGRIVNMLVSLIFIYFAIKKIPFGKKIILLMSYLPIAIEGFTSLSPDAMTISVAFLYISYILSLTFDTRNNIIGKKQIIILTILSIIVALCKIVYIPLVILLFIIPKEKFKNEKKVNTIIFIILIAFAINFIWLGISSIYLSKFREGDSLVQVKSLLIHPIRYIQNCLYTLNLNGSSYITTMFGERLGWGELISVHSIVPYTLFIMAIYITISDKSIKEKFDVYQNLIIIFVLLSIIALIFTSLYVQWTTCESDSIAGIQGRYFIPILPLIMIEIGNKVKIITQYKEEKGIKLIGITGIILQILVISQIIICHL